MNLKFSPSAGHFLSSSRWGDFSSPAAFADSESSSPRRARQTAENGNERDPRISQSPCQGMTAFQRRRRRFYGEKTRRLDDPLHYGRHSGFERLQRPGRSPDLSGEAFLRIDPCEFHVGLSGCFEKTSTGSSRIDYSDVSQGHNKLTARVTGTMGRKVDPGRGGRFPLGARLS